MTTFSSCRTVARLAAVLLAGTSAAAIAQEAPSAQAAPEEMGADIVVTAQKRSERLQDVPISVSAIAGDALQKQRVTQADELVSKIPNLQLTSTVGDNTPIFELRGVSMS